MSQFRSSPAFDQQNNPAFGSFNSGPSIPVRQATNPGMDTSQTGPLVQDRSGRMQPVYAASPRYPMGIQPNEGRAQSSPRVSMLAPTQAPTNPDADLPSEKRMRFMNEGLIPRGPSPQFAASPDGQARFGGAPSGPTPPQGGSVMGTLNGYGPTPAMAQPGQVAGAQARVMSKNDSAYLSQLYAEARASHAANDDEGAQASLKEAREFRRRFHPDGPQSQAPAAPAQPNAQQPSGPTPRTPIDTSDPQWQAQRQASVQNAYQTAAKDLYENPQLGTKPVVAPPPPIQAPLTPVSNDAFNGGAAGRQQASLQGQRNQAAIQRRNNAAVGPSEAAQTANNVAQLDQNQQAAANIEGRLGQFGQGDYSFANPATGHAVKQPGTPQQPQVAQAAGNAQLPAHALQAAQRVGGTVGSDGTMSQGGARYRFDSQRDGWAKIQ